MNAQQLKNSILQEAIEGRLVAQDPNDEPASALQERIREEKRRLVKEGKLKKKDLEEKPISEDEIPFDIPESWEWVRLGDVIDVRDGTHDTPAYMPQGYPLITGKDFYNGYFELSKTQYISETDYLEICKRSKVDIGDILFSMIGGNIGSQILITKDNYFEMAIKNVALFKQYPSRCVNSKYLSLFLESRIENIKSIALGGAQSFVSLKLLRTYLFPLPPLAEQKRIVAKIEELLPKVEEYGKAQDALDKLNAELPERLKKSILQEAISGRLVPQDPNDEPASILLGKIRAEKAKLVKEGKLKKKDLEETPISEDEIPFDIPDSWEWVRIEFAFNHSSGKQLSGADTEGTLREYITTSNLYWDRFELDNLKSMYYKDSELERCTAKKGDLLVCEGGDVGRSAIWPYDYNICLQNHVHRLRPYAEDYTRFVYYVIWYYKSIGDIGGKGIGIKGLSASVLKSIIIPLPPLAEQKRIVAKIEQLLGEIDKLK